jgi:hypothetical protein
MESALYTNSPKQQGRTYLANAFVRKDYGRLLTLMLMFVLVPHHILQAQGESEDPHTSIFVSYSGNNAWNPGISAGIEYPFNNPGRAGEVTDRKTNLYARSVTGLYIDPGSHGGLYSNLGLEIRMHRSKSGAFSVFAHPIGVYRSFLTETYAFENDQVRRVPLAGNVYYAPYAGVGYSKEILKHPGDTWFFNFGVMTLLPYNTYLMPLMMVDIGYRFQWKRGAR